MCKHCLKLEDVVAKNFYEVEQIVKAVKLDRQNGVQNREGFNFNSMRIKFAGLFETLTANEKAVLVFRFGLTSSANRTLADVGALLGLTPARIRQIEHKALRKLSWMERKK